MHNDLYAAKVLECFECFGTTGQRFERVARTHDLHVARFKKRCALEVAREVHCREDAEVELARSQRGKRPFVVCANGDSRSRCDLGHGGKNRFDDHGERIIEAGNSKNALELGRRENGAVSEGSHFFENFACAKSERLRFVGRCKAAAVTLKEFRAEGRSDVSEETACFRLGNTEPFGCEPEIFHFYERANEFKLFFCDAAIHFLQKYFLFFDANAAQNGNYFLRVASSNTKLANGKNVRTVRDVIAEIDQDGYVVDEWRLFDILDPYRSDVIKALDQGAVCLNIDASKAGKTLSEEDIQKLNESDNYGDIAGTGVGRNWAHVNSVDYDPTDDSIIISSRHQSAAVKIGRDKKVKWILAAPRGWKGELAEKLLTPVDKDGKKLVCDDVSCEGGFDWTWTQHTAWRIDEKSAPGIVYLSVFDNGDARGMEQPAMPSMKYSRAVVYNIDEKKMTVEQIWSYGEEAGHDWFSPVTSLTEYHADKDSIFVYSATAGASFDINTGAFTSAPNPYMQEFRWGETTPAVEMRVESTTGYQAMPVDIERAFEK